MNSSIEFNEDSHIHPKEDKKKIIKPKNGAEKFKQQQYEITIAMFPTYDI